MLPNHGIPYIGSQERSKIAQIQPSPPLKHKVAASIQQAPCSIDDMQRSFGKLVAKTLESLEHNKVTVRQLASTLLALGAYEPVIEKEEALLEDHEEKLFQAQSFPDVYRVIHPYMSFFNPELLAYIIETHGTQKNHEDLNEYISKLDAFCQGAVSPPMDLSSKGQSSTTATESRDEIVIKLNLKDRRLQRIRNIKSSIARILGVKEVTLCLVSIQEGCTKITFMVPQFVLKQQFPLLEEQVQKFLCIGALQIMTSNGHQYNLTVGDTIDYRYRYIIIATPYYCN